MSYLEELRRRVDTAERQFGQLGEESQRHSERLEGLVKAAEASLRQKDEALDDQRAAMEALNEKLGTVQKQLESNQAKLAALEAEKQNLTAEIAELEKLKPVAEENEQLRGMLHSLLVAVEAERGKEVNGALQSLEYKLTSIVDPNDTPAPDGRPASRTKPAEDLPATASQPSPSANDVLDDLDLDDSMLAETDSPHSGLDIPETNKSSELAMDEEDEASLKGLMDTLSDKDDSETDGDTPDEVGIAAAPKTDGGEKKETSTGDNGDVGDEAAARSRDIREITQSLRREVSRLEESAAPNPKDTQSAVRNWVKRVRKQRTG